MSSKNCGAVGVFVRAVPEYLLNVACDTAAYADTIERDFDARAFLI